MKLPSDTAELARRAVQCKAWRWMRGMMTDGLRVVAVGDNWVYAYNCEKGFMSSFAVGDGAVPDLGDPATLGCVLHLVREHWGDGGAHTKQAYRSGGYVEWICYAPSVRYPLIMSHGDTEAEALVKALEMEIPND